VEYIPGVAALPFVPNTKLYLFDNIEHATEFMDRNAFCGTGYQWWQCNARRVSPCNVLIAGPMADREAFWKNEGLLRITGNTNRYWSIMVGLADTPPLGTLWADSIILTERVK
jgi:hypothetical protein